MNSQGLILPQENEPKVATVLDLEPWMLFEKDWGKDNPVYWETKALFTFKAYKDMYIRYDMTLKHKRLVGMVLEEYHFIQKNLRFLHDCIKNTEFGIHWPLIKELFLKKKSLRKYAEENKITLKKVQNKKSEAIKSYAYLLHREHIFVDGFVKNMIEGTPGMKYSDDPSDLQIMKRQLITLINKYITNPPELEPYDLSEFEPIDLDEAEMIEFCEDYLRKHKKES